MLNWISCQSLSSIGNLLPKLKVKAIVVKFFDKQRLLIKEYSEF